MNETLRLLLMIAIAGCAITLAGSAAAWWLDEDRRLRRYIRRSLDGPPDAIVIARGRNAGAGFSAAKGRAVVMWQGGAKALLYPLAALRGSELIVNEEVVAHIFRGEPRRVADRIDPGFRTVTLRLVFDNPRDPNFDLDLWLPRDADRRNASAPVDALADAQTWLERSEALLRLPQAAAEPRVPRRSAEAPAASPASVTPPPSESPPPWEDDPDEDAELDDDEDDLFSRRPG